jgi:hypothetical protein
MRRAFANKVDSTAKALIAYAKSLGFDYEPVNGTFDGVLAWGRVAICVDWKSPGGQLTPAQQRMVARGFPVRFLSTTHQLDALKAEMFGSGHQVSDAKPADGTRRSEAP